MLLTSYWVWRNTEIRWRKKDVGYVLKTNRDHNPQGHIFEAYNDIWQYEVAVVKFHIVSTSTSKSILWHEIKQRKEKKQKKNSAQQWRSFLSAPGSVMFSVTSQNVDFKHK